MAFSDAAGVALEDAKAKAYALIVEIAALPLTKQDRLGIAVVATSALVGGSAALLNKIAIDKGHAAMPMVEVTKAVTDLIVKELSKSH